jgi:rare lipoprotein A
MGRNFFWIAKTGGRVTFIVAAALTLANCKTTNTSTGTGFDNKYGVTASPRKFNDGDEIPKGNGRYHVGKPYVIAGVTYYPQEDPNYRASGIASWYGDAFHGRLTSNGEIFDMRSITAAHPTLPLPSYVRVTNLTNGKSLIVRVNDRGPFHANRVIDVSVRAADLLGFKHKGTERVRVEYVGRAKIEGSDDMQLAATLRENGPAPAPNQVRIAQQRPLIQQPDVPQVVRRAPTRIATVAPQQPALAPTTPPASFSPASVTGRGLY